MVACTITHCIYSVRTVPSSGRLFQIYFVGELYRNTSGKRMLTTLHKAAMCNSSCPKTFLQQFTIHYLKLINAFGFSRMAKKMTVHLKITSCRVRNTPAGRSELLSLFPPPPLTIFFLFDFPTGTVGTLASSSLLHWDE